MSYADGRPLSEGEVREYIRGQRAAGTGRAEVRRSLVADDPLEFAGIEGASCGTNRRIPMRDASYRRPGPPS